MISISYIQDEKDPSRIHITATGLDRPRLIERFSDIVEKNYLWIESMHFTLEFPTFANCRLEATLRAKTSHEISAFLTVLEQQENGNLLSDSTGAAGEWKSRDTKVRFLGRFPNGSH